LIYSIHFQVLTPIEAFLTPNQRTPPKLWDGLL
jgi:hypothetical protein